MSTEKVRRVAGNLLTSTRALAALGTAIELRTGSATASPEVQRRIDQVLRNLGLDDDVQQADLGALSALLAEIRSAFLLNLKQLDAPGRQGWTHVEEELLQSQGLASAAFAPMFQRSVVSKLEGLAARLQSPDASFLDVGVAVAAFSTAMAKLCPSLRIVGIDPWEPALKLARKNAEDAGLLGRVELRLEAAESINDTARFDLAWFPAVFIPTERLSAAPETREGGVATGRLDRVRPDEPDRRPSHGLAGRPPLDLSGERTDWIVRVRGVTRIGRLQLSKGAWPGFDRDIFPRGWTLSSAERGTNQRARR